MIALWIILGIIVYVAIGAVIAGIIHHIDSESDWEGEGDFLICLTWPIFIPIALLVMLARIIIDKISDL